MDSDIVTFHGDFRLRFLCLVFEPLHDKIIGLLLRCDHSENGLVIKMFAILCMAGGSNVHSQVMELVHILIYKMDLECNGSRILIQFRRSIFDPACRRSVQLLDDVFLEVDIAGWSSDTDRS